MHCRALQASFHTAGTFLSPGERCPESSAFVIPHCLCVSHTLTSCVHTTRLTRLTRLTRAQPKKQRAEATTGKQWNTSHTYLTIAQPVTTKHGALGTNTVRLVLREQPFSRVLQSNLLHAHRTAAVDQTGSHIAERGLRAAEIIQRTLPSLIVYINTVFHCP